MWKLRNIYLYLVCFATLIMTIASTIGLIQSFANMYFPVDYSYYSSPGEIGKEVPEQKIITEENKRIQERNRSNENMRQLIGSAAGILVAFPVFIYHWRKIEKEKE